VTQAAIVQEAAKSDYDMVKQQKNVSSVPGSLRNRLQVNR